jgi:hypothetical protein
MATMAQAEAAGGDPVIPTLRGRIETRIFLVVVVGGIWTLLITPLVRAVVDSEAMGSPDLVDVYKVTYSVLAIVLVLGILWELVYHALMQFRWEKDWPTLFGYVTIVNEGLLAYAVAKALGTTDPGAPEWRQLLEGLTVAPFLVHFVTTWLVIQLFANNIMQVLFIRWRFRGGRLLGGWTP